jgi:hypothetical protein
VNAFKIPAGVVNDRIAMLQQLRSATRPRLPTGEPGKCNKGDEKLDIRKRPINSKGTFSIYERA